MTVHSKDGKQQTTKLERIGKLAESQKDIVFNNIGHVVDLALLRKSYHQLERNKAVGIDNVRKEDYGRNLEDNLQDLLRRIRQDAYKPQPMRSASMKCYPSDWRNMDSRYTKRNRV